MTIIKVGVPTVIPDNDMTYMTYICRIIKKVDSKAEVTIIKGLRTYAYRITPSEASLKDTLVDELDIAHKLLNVRISFSRTLDFATSIHFEIQ